ncbi:hypothetical protein J1605_005043 [Eschrichtius robustus]|uniref:Uncharacterized protein n=1 Tax=Eschrichtius robustus TaxID=9764 RepID=A0AB34H7Q1_ESCRO|nr:hypothetical protein J1605_005043 [Eschrichtius robustus]
MAGTREAAAEGPDAVGGREREVSAVPDGAVPRPGALAAGATARYCCRRLCRLMAAIGVHLGCTSACVAVYKVRDSGTWAARTKFSGCEAKSFGLLRGCERRVAGLGTSRAER